MLCISFQDAAVVELLIKNKKYFADISKSREKRTYTEDIEMLDGKIPVWVFANVELAKLRDGTLLEMYRCEMSLDQEIGLTQFAMLELEIPDELLKVGKTHNGYQNAKVVPHLDLAWLVAIHKVNHTKHWFYMDIECVCEFKKSHITSSILDTRAERYYGIFENDSAKPVGCCCICDAETTHVEDNKFVCSQKCIDSSCTRKFT